MTEMKDTYTVTELPPRYISTIAIVKTSGCPKCGEEKRVRIGEDEDKDGTPLSHCPVCDTWFPDTVIDVE